MDREAFELSRRTIIIVIIAIILAVGGTYFVIWYNNTLAVPLQNSERHVTTCSLQYLTTQKARISNDLDAIASNNVAIASTKDANLKAQLQAQEKTNADDIYNALDASDCSRQQITQDMPELQTFFQQFPAR